MPKLAALLFILAALGGATLAFLHFSGKKRPALLTGLHGLLAATALALLAWSVFEGGAENLQTALIVFAVAAAGGFFLVSFRLRGRPLPSPVVLIHAGVAAVGLVLLLANLL